MAKQKTPEALQELAAELNLDLGEEENETENLADLIEYVEACIDEARDEEIQRFDAMQAKLDAIITEPTE